MSFSTSPFDTDRAAAFAGRVLDVINNGSLALMMSIGHRTGLFDVMSGLPPSTSAGIAAAARLNEPYVREWLGAMVTSVEKHEPPHDVQNNWYVVQKRVL